jgi:hypothetical protein
MISKFSPRDQKGQRLETTQYMQISLSKDQSWKNAKNAGPPLQDEELLLI